jgi:hypothetical protein
VALDLQMLPALGMGVEVLRDQGGTKRQCHTGWHRCPELVVPADKPCHAKPTEDQGYLVEARFPLPASHGVTDALSLQRDGDKVRGLNTT